MAKGTESLEVCGGGGVPNGVRVSDIVYQGWLMSEVPSLGLAGRLVGGLLALEMYSGGLGPAVICG